jgi:hypothetical protein
MHHRSYSSLVLGSTPLEKFTPFEDQFFLVVHFSKNNASSFFIAWKSSSTMTENYLNMPYEVYLFSYFHISVWSNWSEHLVTASRNLGLSLYSVFYSFVHIISLYILCIHGAILIQACSAFYSREWWQHLELHLDWWIEKETKQKVWLTTVYEIYAFAVYEHVHLQFILGWSLVRERFTFFNLEVRIIWGGCSLLW